MTLVPSTKRKRVSKKNKTSWRKNINIEDVNDFLEEQRLDERIGKVSDKTNDELFVVDKAPKKQKLNARAQRKLAGARPPRSFLGLENVSKVPDPIVKRNRVRTKEERKHFIGKSIAAAKAAKGIIPKRMIQSENDSLASAKKLIERKKAAKAKRIIDKDIWSVGDVIEQHPEFHTQWIDKHVVEHNLCNTGVPINSIPRSAFHKRSKLNNIAIPHPGTSYNPKSKDHKELLQSVIEFEEKIIRKEEHLDRVTTSMFDKMSAEQRDEARRKEMIAGIEELEENNPNDGSDADSSDNDTYKAINPPVVVKPKDRKTRRKAREQKIIKQQLLNAKLEKKKITDIHRLRHLNENIKQTEESLKLSREKKEVRQEEKKLLPRRLGKVIYQEQDIDFSMPEAIAGNLRNVKVEGNVLKDRFKSMQQRNILAPTVDIGLRRRTTIKRFVRKTHKEEEPQSHLKKNNRGAGKIKVVGK